MSGLDLRKCCRQIYLRSALQCAKETSFIQSVILKMTTTKLGTASAFVTWITAHGRARMAVVLTRFKVVSRTSVRMDIRAARLRASLGRSSFFRFAVLACMKLKSCKTALIRLGRLFREGA